MKKGLPVLAGIFLALLLSPPSPAGVITRLPTHERVVALTFDACQTITPAYFDMPLLNYLLKEKLPFTLFLSGKFAREPVNALVIRELAGNPLVEIENHSFSHPFHMERLPDWRVKEEILKTQDLLLRLTGRKTRLFRFPGGYCNARTVALAERLGYRVVHWTFASGDPDRRITPKRLEDWVLRKTRPGSILIFHINGRGYSTAKALPVIVEELKRRGYRFVRLDQFIGKLPEPHPGERKRPGETPPGPPEMEICE